MSGVYNLLRQSYALIIVIIFVTLIHNDNYSRIATYTK